MKEIKDFIEKLKDERNEQNQKLRFVIAHKFIKEEQYIADKLLIINNILYELDDVADGKTKGIDARFRF